MNKNKRDEIRIKIYQNAASFGLISELYNSDATVFNALSMQQKFEIQDELTSVRICALILKDPIWFLLNRSFI